MVGGGGERGREVSQEGLPVRTRRAGQKQKPDPRGQTASETTAPKSQVKKKNEAILPLMVTSQAG